MEKKKKKNLNAIDKTQAQKKGEGIGVMTRIRYTELQFVC
jgi:hypothetical protein